ncbi:hypothetical protein [Bradyrhizobium sp. Ai1a-2]|uniref:hypothetical protein n=1 Tax=Bradyrhizobium sp. Ai1a-2 TaxID=196490 RepID=UPI00126935ED|nr:hypothetical protein [Bradyrhizobium sp. Ai1a-2]
MEGIRQDGLAVDAGFWRMIMSDIKDQLEDLWRSPELSTKLTRPDSKDVLGICACARKQDALYYACNHNRKAENTASILISFEADPDDVVVDGRDFLYTVVQLGKPVTSRASLERLFGPAVLRYADRAWATSVQDSRVACVDLAIHDADIITAHSANQLVIGGRNRTRFASAFIVRGPIAAERIVSVERVDHRDYSLPRIDIALDDAIGRR